MDTPIVVAVISLGVAVITGFFTWRTSGRANDRNADLSWAREIRQDAIDARKEVEALQAKVHNLSRQVDAMQRETEYWIGQYQLAHRTAWRPGMTIERLRELFGPDTPTHPGNGTLAR